MLGYNIIGWYIYIYLYTYTYTYIIYILRFLIVMINDGQYWDKGTLAGGKIPHWARWLSQETSGFDMIWPRNMMIFHGTNIYPKWETVGHFNEDSSSVGHCSTRNLEILRKKKGNQSSCFAYVFADCLIQTSIYR